MSMLFFYGCSPAGILASGGATTMVVAEGERSLGSVVDEIAGTLEGSLDGINVVRDRHNKVLFLSVVSDRIGAGAGGSGTPIWLPRDFSRVRAGHAALPPAPFGRGHR